MIKQTALAVLMIPMAALSTVYRVSSDGTTDYRTVSDANGIRANAGDTILFEGGATFSGTLSPRNGGATGNPVVIGSFGEGRAIIESGGNAGASLAKSYLEVRDLVFRGNHDIATAEGNASDHGITLGGVERITLENCDISRYPGHGVFIERGADGHRIVGCEVHHNGHDGITTELAWNTATRQLVSYNLYIGYTHVHHNKGFDSDNSSGNGIMLRQVDTALIEYCESDSNGYGWGGRGGGPVGIWSWDCNAVVVQYCESHHNRNGAGGVDGGGFDCDGGDSYCVIQYCYSHDNDGPGFFIAHFGGSHPTHHNTIRYCIGESDALVSQDGQMTVQGALNFWGGATDNYVYNNVIYGGYSTASTRTGRVFKNEGTAPRNYVLNNVFLSAYPITVLDAPPSDDITFKGNCYFSIGGQPRLVWAGTVYNDLQSFRAASGQEMHDGQPVGTDEDPLMITPGEGRTIGDPTNLHSLGSYQVQSGSSCIDAGLSVSALLGLDPVATDFWGNPVPSGTTVDIGPHELQSVEVVAPRLHEWTIGASQPAFRHTLSGRRIESPTAAAVIIAPNRMRGAAPTTRVVVPGRRVGPPR